MPNPLFKGIISLSQKFLKFSFKSEPIKINSKKLLESNLPHSFSSKHIEQKFILMIIITFLKSLILSLSTFSNQKISEDLFNPKSSAY